MTTIKNRSSRMPPVIPTVRDARSVHARVRKVWAYVIIAIFLAVMSASCSRPYTQTPNPFEIDAREYRRIYNAAVLVLREHGFRLGRQDYRFGRVTTLPLPAPTVFEPWLVTNTTAKQNLVSTLNQQRRIVTIYWEPTALQDRSPTRSVENAARADIAYQMRIEVHLEQKQTPVRRLNGSTSGHAIMTSLKSPPLEWVEQGIDEPSYWQPIGRDPHLEQRLTAAIVRRSLNIHLLSPVNTPPVEG